MFFYDIIHKTNSKDVEKEYLKYYDNELLQRSVNEYKRLIDIECGKVIKSTTSEIFIEGYDEEGDLIENPDLYEAEIYYDVSVKVKGEDILYSPAGADYCELLGYGVAGKTLKRFTPEQIAAHVIWELEW